MLGQDVRTANVVQCLEKDPHLRQLHFYREPPSFLGLLNNEYELPAPYLGLLNNEYELPAPYACNVKH